MSELTFKLIPVKEALPEVKGLVSQTILFQVDGEIYSGHYHSNGWFYCDEKHNNNSSMMAKGPNATCGIVSWSYLPKSECTAWTYLRGNDDY